MICSAKISLAFEKNSLSIFAINSIYDKYINNIDQNLYTCCFFETIKDF